MCGAQQHRRQSHLVGAPQPAAAAYRRLAPPRRRSWLKQWKEGRGLHARGGGARGGARLGCGGRGRSGGGSGVVCVMMARTCGRWRLGTCAGQGKPHSMQRVRLWPGVCEGLLFMPGARPGRGKTAGNTLRSNTEHSVWEWLVLLRALVSSGVLHQIMRHRTPRARVRSVCSLEDRTHRCSCQAHRQYFESVTHTTAWTSTHARMTCTSGNMYGFGTLICRCCTWVYAAWGNHI